MVLLRRARSWGPCLADSSVPCSPPEIGVGAFEVHFVSNLPVIFLASGLLRLAVTVLFMKPLKEVRDVEPISHHELFQELPLIKP
jgi:hypothetical protein